jgi:hypothetical protein
MSAVPSLSAALTEDHTVAQIGVTFSYPAPSAARRGDGADPRLDRPGAARGRRMDQRV